MVYERQYDEEIRHRVYNWEGSSRIHSLRAAEARSYPAVLSVCHDSRMVGLSILACLQADFGCTWTSMVHNQFYIGGDSWTRFKLLVDCTIRENTSRKQHPAVCQDLEYLPQIRHFVVDFNVFASAPPTIWSHFPDLETLTIAFRPTVRIVDRPLQNGRHISENPIFLTPHPHNKFGIRASWILDATNKHLALVGRNAPKWNIPQVIVTVRASGYPELDMAIREPSIDQKLMSDDAEEEHVRGELEQEAKWLTDATYRIELSRCDFAWELKRLKRRHHRNGYYNRRPTDQYGCQTLKGTSGEVQGQIPITTQIVRLSLAVDGT